MNRVGWDIGGAHLKAACLNSKGEIIAVYQQTCPLWQGLDKLHIALSAIRKKLPLDESLHAITMTGELVDLFSDRAEGVLEIIAVMQQTFRQQIVQVYAGQLGFIASSDVCAEHIDVIASANWLATVTYLAQHQTQGLLVDLGSTTTDIILFQNNQPDVLGYTDFQRLSSGELVYTGLLRTAIMAVVQSVHFAGNQVGIMSEHFATMADVYRVTHELNEQNDQTETADGHAKTGQASIRRLARMVGCDAQDFPVEEWQALAYAIREQQLNRIQVACEQQLLRSNETHNNCLVGAGIGRFLVQEIAFRLGISYLDFTNLFSVPKQTTQMQVADCAPAVAVAYLSINSNISVACNK